MDIGLRFDKLLKNFD